MSEFDLFTRLAAGDRTFVEPVCSRAECGATATRRIEWRNPRIHSEDRIKIWLACEEHFDFLRDFLASRAFPLRVHAIDDDLDEERIA